MGGKFHLKLNIGERPIANKYREGKMQRTLKRELKVLEIVKREAIGISVLNFSEIAIGFPINFAAFSRSPTGVRLRYARGQR